MIFFSKFSKNHQFLQKISKYHHFLWKFEKIINFFQNLKNHKFLKKKFKIINFCEKFEKIIIFCENLKKSSFFAKIFQYNIFVSITLVSPVSRDQSHSLSIAIVLRYWGDTGMSTCNIVFFILSDYRIWFWKKCSLFSSR